MPAKLAHIAIKADDVDRARQFYERIFGWTFSPWGPPEFFHIKGAGVHGALQKRQSPLPEGRKGIECTFAVVDLEHTCSQITTHGGSVIDAPFEIPSVGRLVHVQDTEQNEFIIMQYEPSYASELGIEID